jgi:hypothetical protein
MLRRFFAAALGALALANAGFAADTVAPAKSVYTFGTLRTWSADAAKTRVKAWLEGVGKFDAKAFDAVWADDSRPVFDRTVDALCLGSTEAKAALDAARDPNAPAPAAVPGVLKDAAQDGFFRANLATAYAKALGGKRVYEEALEALKTCTPELVADPSQYFFYRAVAEHATIKRTEGMATILRLNDDVADTPDRYRMVATLMFFDMQNWSPDRKDLANIGRLMDNSGRRLDLARPGEKTQDIQKKIVFRLDELIKEMESQCKGGQCNGGNCPGGGSKPGGNTVQPGGPAGDSVIMGGSGEGKVDEKKLRKLAEEWGKLPPSERAKAIQEFNRDLPAKFKPMIEDYFKSLNKIHNVNP